MKISLKNITAIKSNNNSINFTGRNIQFNPYFDASKVPHGVNYEVVDSFEC